MEFNITSSTLNTSFNYKDVIVVQGNYVKDAVSGNLKSINGACYRKNEQGEMGDYIGNFNGYPQSDDSISYDLSQMKRSDSNLVWDAIDDIEAKILGENVE
jgi:hypothetical protein